MAESSRIEVSNHPRPQDLSQLQSAYVMHRQECRMCTPEQSCEMAKRLEKTRDAAGVAS